MVVRFKPERARDVPLFVAGLPIFSRAYYSKQPFDETTLDVPLGSGPYKVGRFEPGRYIEYERVKDWWGADLPVVARPEQFRHRALRILSRPRRRRSKASPARSYLFREEFTSRIWATRYDFPAIKDGRVKREVIPDDTPSGAQGWFINTRRRNSRIRKLREALIYAFDFEWTNKTIMYGSYDRTHSVFQNSEMMANGKPGADELALLEPFRGKVPDEVFGEPFVPPVSDGSGQDRALLRRGAPASAARPATSSRTASASARTASASAIEFLIEEPTVPAAPHAVHQESRHARHRRHGAHRRSGADAEAPQRLRFRHHDPALRLLGDAGRFAAHAISPRRRPR